LKKMISTIICSYCEGFSPLLQPNGKKIAALPANEGFLHCIAQLIVELIEDF
jgi:hypothetical protein